MGGGETRCPERRPWHWSNRHHRRLIICDVRGEHSWDGVILPTQQGEMRLPGRVGNVTSYLLPSAFLKSSVRTPSETAGSL